MLFGETPSWEIFSLELLGAESLLLYKFSCALKEGSLCTILVYHSVGLLWNLVSRRSLH